MATTQNVVELMIRAKDQASAELRKARGAQDELNKTIGSGRDILKDATRAAIGYMGAYAGYQQIKDAMNLGTQFGEKMAFVNTLARKSGAEFDAMSKGLREVKKEFGQLGTASHDALYDIYSVLGDTGKNLDLLKASAGAAVAGMVDITETGAAVTGAMYTMGIAADKVNDVLDVQFKTIEVGKIRYKDLAQFSGYFLASAREAGQEYDRTMAMFATLTKTLGRPEQAATSLAQALAIFKGPEFEKTLKKMGLTAKDSEGNFRDFDKVLVDIQKKISGLSESGRSQWIAKLFPSMEAQRAVVGWINDLNTSLKELDTVTKNRAGAFQNAFGMMSDTDAQKIKQAQARIEDLKISIGQELAPAVSQAFGEIGQHIDELAANGKLEEFAAKAGDAFAKLMDVAMKLFDFLMDHGHEIKTVAVFIGIMTAVGKLKGAFDVAKIAVKAFGSQMTTTAGESASAAAAINSIKFVGFNLAVAGTVTAIYNAIDAWHEWEKATKRFQDDKATLKDQRAALGATADTNVAAFQAGNKLVNSGKLKLRAGEIGELTPEKLKSLENYYSGLLTVATFADKSPNSQKKMLDRMDYGPGKKYLDYAAMQGAQYPDNPASIFNMAKGDKMAVEKLFKDLGLEYRDGHLSGNPASSGAGTKTGGGAGLGLPSDSSGGGKGDARKKAVDKLKAAAGDKLPMYEEAAAYYGVPLDILLAVSNQESRFNAKAKSPAGAMGLMQLMPGTAKKLGVTDPWNPQQNIMGGAKYLRQVNDQFKGNWDLTLAGYNWGPNRDSLKRGDMSGMPKETRDYIKKIKGSLGGELTSSGGGDTAIYDVVQKIEDDQKKQVEALGTSMNSLLAGLKSGYEMNRQLQGERIRYTQGEGAYQKWQIGQDYIADKQSMGPQGADVARMKRDARLQEIKDAAAKQRRDLALEANAPDAFNLPKRETELSDWLEAERKTLGDSQDLNKLHRDKLEALYAEYTAWQKAQLGHYRQFTLEQLDRMVDDFATKEEEKLRIKQEIDRRIQAGEVGNNEAFIQGFKGARESFESEQQKMLRIGRNTADGIQQAFGDSFVSAFHGDIENIGDVWDNLMRSMVDSYIRAQGEMLAKKFLLGGDGGGGGFLDILGLGNLFGGGGSAAAGLMSGGGGGAMAFAANGGIFRGPLRRIAAYANGGIITDPTIMVGEGKYNEAIVPLPDGKSIPVQMRGGQGGGGGTTIVNHHYHINALDAKSLVDRMSTDGMGVIEQAAARVAAKVAPAAVQQSIANGGRGSEFFQS